VTTLNEPAGTQTRQKTSVGRVTVAGVVLTLIWTGAAAVLSKWWLDTPSVSGFGWWLTGAGQIAGLLGGYGCAILVALMARVPMLERQVGSDRIARWHAMAGRYTLSLVLAHATLIIWGSTVLRGSTVPDEAWGIITNFPKMVSATVGTLILFAVGIVSARAVRSRVSYEVWYYLHLLTYLAVYLAFGHQVVLGFSESFPARVAWYALYLTAAALVLWFRILTPVRANLTHRLRVESIKEEAPGVYSVEIRGRNLEDLAPEPGQFFRWRFLAQGMWWTSHPYSLSGTPRPDLMRITVKASGGHSAAVSLLRPGTRVWAEGPYGALTAARRRRPKVVLIAGGIGVTPLLTLFATLPAGPGDMTLIYRARRREDLALHSELDAIAKDRGARLVYTVDSTHGRFAPLTSDVLREVLPDIDQHDAYVCGPPGMAQTAFDALRGAGVPQRNIHHESFSL
jgi:predicted ferric reductase